MLSFLFRLSGFFIFSITRNTYILYNINGSQLMVKLNPLEYVILCTKKYCLCYNRLPHPKTSWWFKNPFVMTTSWLPIVAGHWLRYTVDSITNTSNSFNFSLLGIVCHSAVVALEAYKQSSEYYENLNVVRNINIEMYKWRYAFWDLKR